MSLSQVGVVGLEPEQILVVDDESLIRTSLAECLVNEGYLCKTARTGREAQEKLAAADFALVITDIQMPEVDGLELLDFLSLNLPEVATIMITGRADVKTAVKTMQQGAFDYISKPFDLEQVLEKIKGALERRAALLEENEVFRDLERLVRKKSAGRGRRTGSSASSDSGVAGTMRKLAVIMFTDMVGYSSLTEQSEELALELLVEHRELLRPFFSKHGGREIKTMGDAFLVEFSSALEAVRCAIETQQMLVDRNRLVPVARRIQIRIGLHLGDVLYRNQDVYGDGVNIAARIEPLAETNGICISEDVVHQVKNKIEQTVVCLEHAHLKNIEFPHRVYKIVLPWEEAAEQIGAS